MTLINAMLFFFFNDMATTEIYTLSLHDALPILFGLNAEQVADSRGWYNPRWHYEHDPETREALDLIAGNHFSRHEPGVFAPLLDSLLGRDYYLHLADLAS